MGIYQATTAPDTISTIIADEQYQKARKEVVRRNLVVSVYDPHNFRKKIINYLKNHPEISYTLKHKLHRGFYFRFKNPTDMERVFLDVCMMGREK